MKPFGFLLVCASSWFGLWLGSPAQANSTPEFIDQSPIALNQSGENPERQRDAERELRESNPQGRDRQENKPTPSGDRPAEDRPKPPEQSELERQRQAERDLKERHERERQGRDRQENKPTPSGDRPSEDRPKPPEQSELERQRQAERDLKERQERERQERERRERREQRDQERWEPSQPSVIIIEQPQPYRPIETGSPSSNYNSGYDSSGQTNRDRGTITLSTGFNGSVNPAIGYRLPSSNIGFEIGAVFNQDALPPGTVNDYPAGSLIQQFPNGFNNLGVKNTTPNIGGDIIGYYDVSPQVTLHGGVGIYFQGRSQITQSNATTDLFKETNETATSFALSGGADFRVSDAVRIGAGYHSLRGVTARIGIAF